jgi:hypothetical protein
VRTTLSKFGVASVSWASDSEFGDARVFVRDARRTGEPNPLFLGIPGAKGSNPDVMVALTRAPGEVTIYMDAKTRQSSERLWRNVVRKCGITDLGR